MGGALLLLSQRLAGVQSSTEYHMTDNWCRYCSSDHHDAIIIIIIIIINLEDWV